LFWHLHFSWLHVGEHSQFLGAVVAGGGVVDGGVVSEQGGDLIGKSRSNIVLEQGYRAFTKEEISLNFALC
jgi:hypothetical protein